MGIVLNPGAGGNVLNTDLVGGLDTQIVKLGVGDSGIAPTPVSSKNPLPVAGTVTVAGIATPVTVNGTVSVNGTTAIAGQVAAEMQDGAGNPLSSLSLGGKQALTIALVDSGGNQITSFGGSGGTSDLDGSVFTRGTSYETPIAGIVETSPPTLTPGTVAALSMDVNGNVRVSLDAGGAQSGTAGTPSPDVVSMQGIVGMVPLAVTIQPNDLPMTNRARIKSGATLNQTNLKTAPGIILGWALFNTQSTPRYFKFYDKAAAPQTTDTPAFTIPIPANGGTNVSFGDTGGVPFATGIAYSITGGVADTDATNTAVDDVHGVVIWD